MVEAGEVGKIVRGIGEFRIAVVFPAVAVVNIVPEPALVRVLLHGLVVKIRTQINKTGAG